MPKSIVITDADYVDAHIQRQEGSDGVVRYMCTVAIGCKESPTGPIVYTKTFHRELTGAAVVNGLNTVFDNIMTTFKTQEGI